MVFVLIPITIVPQTDGAGGATAFHRFGDLPGELRNKIWSLVDANNSTTRVVPLHITLHNLRNRDSSNLLGTVKRRLFHGLTTKKLYITSNFYPTPIVLHVYKDSRSLFLDLPSVPGAKPPKYTKNFDITYCPLHYTLRYCTTNHPYIPANVSTALLYNLCCFICPEIDLHFHKVATWRDSRGLVSISKNLLNPKVSLLQIAGSKLMIGIKKRLKLRLSWEKDWQPNNNIVFISTHPQADHPIFALLPSLHDLWFVSKAQVHFKGMKRVAMPLDLFASILEYYIRGTNMWEGVEIFYVVARDAELAKYLDILPEEEEYDEAASRLMLMSKWTHHVRKTWIGASSKVIVDII